MNRTLLTLAAVGALLTLPAPGWAQSWQRACQSGANHITTSLGPGSTACFEPDASNDVSPVLTLNGVDNFDIQLYDDKDGDTTVCTVTWEVEGCPPGWPDLSASELTEACEILPGTAALSGDDAETNIAAVAGIRVKGDGAGANAADCIIAIKGAAGAK